MLVGHLSTLGDIRTCETSDQSAHEGTLCRCQEFDMISGSLWAQTTKGIFPVPCMVGKNPLFSATHPPKKHTHTNKKKSKSKDQNPQPPNKKPCRTLQNPTEPTKHQNRPRTVNEYRPPHCLCRCLCAGPSPAKVSHFWERFLLETAKCVLKGSSTFQNFIIK